VVEQPIRNRQVASSTLALGSNIPLEDKDLADSLDCLCPIRCKVVTNFEVFARRIHRAHLRFIHALDVNVLSYPDVAVAKNRLDGFVVHAEVVKVCRDTPAKCVPAVPVGKGIVTLIGVAFGFVLILLLLADGAARKRRRNGALHKVIEVQGLSSSTLKDRADCELPHALPVSSECVCQLLHNWDRGLSPYTQTVFGSQRFGTPHETVRLAA
jgi:hypothetical protein